ncbi:MULTISPECIES: EAL domain-containing protein [unclassified Arthrobacter]|uniref:EAL domain-containing protein n=1 Tax=unclassified Arthrobacter TaxID=235627 RepID=UPI002E08910F|nr:MULTISPECIES: EAL domain-containing protein [unclassified Arthrobacter]MEC5192675.1 diguanylate cyclase (GGDEF)-like protein [Arthrobacter sp. MP_M4]MEC5204158.1 diguanylate cyclase (GGDEF)-like protein [Arthrobacter sp. MP_M7]
MPRNSPAVPGTSTVTTRVLLQVVAKQAGAEGVDRVLERAGLRAQADQLHSVGERISYPDKLRLFESAASELADPRIGLRLAQASHLDPAIEPWRRLARAQGTPAGMFRGISQISTRFDSAAVFKCEWVEESSAALAWNLLPPYRPSRFDCDCNIGLLAEIPVLFGLPAARVDHGGICQVNGAPECVYEVVWSAPRLQRLRRLLGRLKRDEAVIARRSTAEHRLRMLEGAAADLASSTPLEELLDKILSRADSAVHAPGHLLAVRTPAGGRHVLVRGMGGALAKELDGEEMALKSSSLATLPVLSVPVASAQHSYGVLAAVAHPGQEFFAEDIDALSAYARHAAVSLDFAGIVAEAREHGETARLLLGVSRSLAQHSTVEALAGSIADAVPSLSGADRSAVALWESESGRLRIAGMNGWHGELADQLAAYETTAQESPELSEVIACGVPLLVDGNSSDWARKMLADFALSALAAVPIMAGDQLKGLVLAHWADQPASKALEGALIERLTGLAALAAVSLDNIRLLEDARRQALHDPLTGLPNRALLEDRLETSLARAGRNGRRVGLLFCDVNRFKRINDSLGHGAGDSVLRHVAAQIAAAVRDCDTVARYSGDEFVILLPDIQTPLEADHVAARVRAALAEPIEVSGRKIFVDVAIGTSVSCALPPGDTDTHSESARRLIEAADFDMYRAKARARGQTPPGVPRKDYLRLETDLRGAAGRGELRVQFQPQICLATDTIIAAEALVRWHHPELGLLPPVEFIPLAEDSNLISEIGAHVLAEACRTGAQWRAAGHDIEIAVNVSAGQLSDTGFPAVVRDTLAQTGFPAAALTLEVTESQAVSESVVNDGTLRELRSIGVGISIDDFGTGYSSLAQLHRLPVTEVKIDRSFTTRLADGGSTAFIAGIVGLGHGLGLRVVAEGVETSDQLDALRAMGCERAQGYLFGKPVDAADLEEQLHAGNHRQEHSQEG